MIRRLIEAAHSPRVYLGIQRALGFRRARRKCIERRVRPQPGMRVLDVGCGPGAIRDLLGDVQYTGFDTDSEAIAWAQRRYGDRGLFIDGALDADVAAERGPFDLVLLFGLLHHLDDGEVAELLATCRGLLADGGRVFTLDGCYREGQPWLDRFQLDRDQGRFVRDRAGYLALAEAAFDDVRDVILDRYTLLPYTLLVMECSAGSRAGLGAGG